MVKTLPTTGFWTNFDKIKGNFYKRHLYKILGESSAALWDNFLKKFAKGFERIKCWKNYYTAIEKICVAVLDKCW